MNGKHGPMEYVSTTILTTNCTTNRMLILEWVDEGWISHAMWPLHP